jgi:hypothetical protein
MASGDPGRAVAVSDWLSWQDLFTFWAGLRHCGRRVARARAVPDVKRHPAHGLSRRRDPVFADECTDRRQARGALRARRAPTGIRCSDCGPRGHRRDRRGHRTVGQASSRSASRDGSRCCLRRRRVPLGSQAARAAGRRSPWRNTDRRVCRPSIPTGSCWPVSIQSATAKSVGTYREKGSRISFVACRRLTMRPSNTCKAIARCTALRRGSRCSFLQASSTCTHPVPTRLRLSDP